MSSDINNEEIRYFMSTMLLLLICAIFAFSILVFKYTIKFAEKWMLTDIPTSRRRHPRPIPIIGGVAVLICTIIGLTTFCFLRPDWFQNYKTTLLVIGVAVLLLHIVGLIDDLKGLGPMSKLLFQFLAAALVLAYEPRLHDLNVYWSQKIGFWIYPLTAFWIVGLTNAMNLIDGLDGLAGSTALLVAGSIAILSSYWGAHAEFGANTMIVLIPVLLAFLVYNWSPAKIFLGDNGSLPLGFLIACVGLMCPPTKTSSHLIAGIFLMMGYPILDMSLCVYRRLKNNTPLFKADRNHLHHRLLRLGLSVSESTTLLLSITVYLQLSAICINIMKSEASALYLAFVISGLFSVIYLLNFIERKNTATLAHSINNDTKKNTVKFVDCTVAEIDLSPLYEVGLFEEKEHVKEIVLSLKLLLRTSIRANDNINLIGQKISIVYVNQEYTPKNITALKMVLHDKLKHFQEIYNLQYSINSLPISFSHEYYMVSENGTYISTRNKAA